MEIENYQLSRRKFVQFIAGAAAAAGLSQTAVTKLAEQLVTGAAAWTKPELIWLENQVCGGCETSTLALRRPTGTPGSHAMSDAMGIPNTSAAVTYNGGAFNGGNSLENEAFPGESALTITDLAIDVVDIKVFRIGGCAAGHTYYKVIEPYLNGTKGGHILLPTGSVPIGSTTNNAIGREACVPFADHADRDVTSEEAMIALAKTAGVVLATGTCSSYGGIPAAENQNLDPVGGRFRSTSATSTENCLRAAGINTPVVRVPNCPVNPNALFLTLAQYLVDVVIGKSMSTFQSRLTSDGRLKEFSVLGEKLTLYGQTVHGPQCPRYPSYQAGAFAAGFEDIWNEGVDATGAPTGAPRCLLNLGCKGPGTEAPCSNGGPEGGFWNDFAKQFCPKQGMPCVGCGHEMFPFPTDMPMYNY